MDLRATSRSDYEATSLNTALEGGISGVSCFRRVEPLARDLEGHAKLGGDVV